MVFDTSRVKEDEDIAEKLTGHTGGTVGRIYGYFQNAVIRDSIDEYRTGSANPRRQTTENQELM